MYQELDLLSDTKPLVKHPWMRTKRFVLVTEANITECIDACIHGKNGRFALDLETTGLDNRVDATTKTTKDQIVGVCLSGDGITGWYIPLRHQNTPRNPTAASHNVPFDVFDREFRRLMAAMDEGRIVAVLHNGKFDIEFLEWNGREPYGNWDIPKHWEDTLILAYLRHSRARRKSLKVLAAASPEEPTAEQINLVGGRGLGMEMFELEDLFPIPDKGQPPPKIDFSLLDPSEEGPLIYGCSDGICTWLLADLLLPEVLQPEHGFNQKYIYTVEKLCVTATRWMERNRILTSPDKVMELIKLGQQEWFDAMMSVYDDAERVLGRNVMPGFYKVLRYGSAENGQGKFVADNPLCLLPQQITFAKSRAAMWYRDPVGVVESHGKKWPLIYDVNAPQQLGKMFEEMQVPGLTYTEKSKQVVTAKAELERVIEEAAERFPFMGKIRKFRETNKALSSYLYPMLDEVDATDFTMRINFGAHKVDTGRFSTPAKDRELGEKNSSVRGWPEINLQSMPTGADTSRPACMTRLRECIVARPGYHIAAIDFSGEELRLVTNLSGEPKWLDEFFHCSGCNRKFSRGDGVSTPVAPPARCPNCGSDKIGDLHTLTALSIYGQDAPGRDNWKALRGYAKSTNFALCYGGGGMAVVRACKNEIDKNEGWRIKNQFDATYSGLRQWWAGQHKFAEKYGFVLTAFGRIYPVPDIWSADGGFRSKAERNAVNGPIQGSGADIIKIAMGVVYRECKKRGWLDKVRMIATMHDELVFEIENSLLEEAIRVITPLMTSNPMVTGMKWAVPLTTDCEIGPNWAVNWALNEMLHAEVRFDGDQKCKEPKKPQKEDKKYLDQPGEYAAALAAYPAKHRAWEEMPHCWPASLRPLFKDKGAFDGLHGAVDICAEIAARVDTEAPRAEAPQDLGTSAPNPPAAPPTPAGDIFEYCLKADLTPGHCAKLASVILECQIGGTHKLRLSLSNGTVLTGWSDVDFYVIPDQFYWAAHRMGL